MQDDSETIRARNNEKLLKILSIEVYRDGGIARLNFLPRYNTLIPKLLSSLKTKLASFLQKHEDIFQIDGNCVKLLNQGVVRKCINTDDDVILCAARELERRTGYELQKRVSKMKRRRQRAAPQLNFRNEVNEYHEPELPVPGATLDWLCRKVQNALHSYIRLCPDRPVDAEVFSEEWFSVASHLYLRFLEKLTQADNEKEKFSGSQGSRCSFRLSSSIHDGKLEPLHTFVHLINPPLHSDNSGGYDLDLAKKISRRVNIILREKAPPVGGMEFGKLLQDYDLRVLTGGNDLRALIDKYPDNFQDVEIFNDDKRGGPSTTGATAYIKQVKDLRGANIDSKCNTSTLVADEVGTFSLTKPRLALAMAKLLLNACTKRRRKSRVMKNDNDSKTIKCGDENSQKGVALEAPSTCIDLTAGVGGNTIAFCKLFDKVYAYEIDEARSKLLKKNLESNLTAIDRCKVEVECRDSMEALQDLSIRLRKSGCFDGYLSVFVDPPFGGIHYRSNNEDAHRSLNLGVDMPLKRVVSLLSVHLSPVSIGLKVPLLFDVASFIEDVKVEYAQICKQNLNIQAELMKKIERQFFVVLDVEGY